MSDPNNLPGDPLLPPGVTQRDLDADYPYDEDAEFDRQAEKADEDYDFQRENRE